MNHTIKQTFEMLANEIEGRERELELLTKQVNRYKMSFDAEKWLKLKRGDKLRLLRIDSATAKLEREDIVRVKSVDFYPNEEKRTIEVTVFCRNDVNNYSFRMECLIYTHTRKLVIDGNREIKEEFKSALNCSCRWNFEVV